MPWLIPPGSRMRRFGLFGTIFMFAGFLTFYPAGRMEVVSAVAQALHSPESEPVIEPGGGLAPTRRPAETWNRWQQSLEEDEEPIFPDFSYAGYHHGEQSIPEVSGPVFNVTDYGAVPDDSQDDQAGIQEAIDAASREGGGVVFFPPGTYLVVTDMNHREPIVLNTSRVVLRGSGSGRNGTVIRQVHHSLKNPHADFGFNVRGDRFFMLEVRSPEPGGKGRVKLVEDAPMNAHHVVVADGSDLKAGDWVTVRVKASVAATEDLLHPQVPKPAWTTTRDKGLSLQEFHQIKAVEGNRVIFTSPLKTTFKQSYGSHIIIESMIEEVGIEDIAFMGNWIGNFAHHHGGYNDQAYNAVLFYRVANSWLRRCAFISLNEAFAIRQSCCVSALGIRYGGLQGHYSGHALTSNDILFGLLAYDGHTAIHANSTENRASGIVFWRSILDPLASIDNHAVWPYATLHDVTEGGIMTYMGGGLTFLPNHLKHWVIWNFNHQRTADPAVPQRRLNLNFWSNSLYIVSPILVGLYGDSRIEVEPQSVGIVDSLGAKVEPESLYEAQLERRLGALPSWLTTAREAWDFIREERLPAFFNPYAPSPEVEHHFIEPVPIPALLWELSQMTLRHQGLADIAIDAPSNMGSIRTDWTKLRQAIYSLLRYAYGFNMSANGVQLIVNLAANSNRASDGTVFTIRGRHGEPAGYYEQQASKAYIEMVGENRARDWDGAQQIAASLRATLQRKTTTEGFEATLTIKDYD